MRLVSTDEWIIWFFPPKNSRRALASASSCLEEGATDYRTLGITVSGLVACHLKTAGSSCFWHCRTPPSSVLSCQFNGQGGYPCEASWSDVIKLHVQVQLIIHVYLTNLVATHV